MAKSSNPYRNLPQKAFWRSAIGERHSHDIEDISRPIGLSQNDIVATAGSCFAQHIGRHLRHAGTNCLDLEPAPDFLPVSQAARYGYGLYSCRYGNIYTARQLLQLAQEALGRRHPSEVVWKKNGRCYDALRPSVDPFGHASEEHVLRIREKHLKAVAEMFHSLDVFVFTMGLTEAWVSRADDTVYPTAAGTVAGTHSDRYYLRNFRYNDVDSDLREFWELLRSVNPNARMLLTVSPVPMAATASPDHILVANVRSKSVLRAVAGDLSEDEPGIYYFPSYEIISAHPWRGMFYNPDLRTVNDAGVSYVMQHFFRSFDGFSPNPTGETSETGEIICDEELLEQFATAEQSSDETLPVSADFAKDDL